MTDLILKVEGYIWDKKYSKTLTTNPNNRYKINYQHSVNAIGGWGQLTSHEFDSLITHLKHCSPVSHSQIIIHIY